MAQLPQPFNANDHEPAGTFELMPPGWYTAMITESEMKQTKDGRGHYLQLTFQVLEGPHSGRVAWDRLNLVNNSQTAVDIAQRTLSAICHAVGVLAVQDSTQLHNKPLQIKLKVAPAKGEYSAKNEIEGYRKPDGQVPAPSAPAPTATTQATAAPAEQAAAQAGTDSVPPWMRKAS